MEMSEIRNTYKELRNVENTSNKYFIYYLIKTVAGVGYYDKISGEEFKKNYDEVMNFVINNPNLQRIADQYDVITNYETLRLMNEEN